MNDQPIGMDEMRAIFEVVDRLELSREAIEVDLLRAADGSVRRLANGKFAIAVPAGVELGSWSDWLDRALRAAGAGAPSEGSD